MLKLTGALLLCAAAGLPGAAQGRTDAQPLPKHFAAVRSGADLHGAHGVAYMVNSRDSADPVSPIRAEKLVAQVRDTLTRSKLLQPVDDAAAAQWNLELVVEEHERWGPFHSQNGPYLFLLVRERASGDLLYCGYQRVGFSYGSAAGDLLNELVGQVKGSSTAPAGEIAACVAEARRTGDAKL